MANFWNVTVPLCFISSAYNSEAQLLGILNAATVAHRGLPPSSARMITWLNVPCLADYPADFSGYSALQRRLCLEHTRGDAATVMDG